MFKFFVALIVTSFTVPVYAVITFDKPAITNVREANEHLDVPQRAEALPVVLIVEDNKTLSIPDNIQFLKAEHKKIVNGTQFYMTLTGNRRQMFFCPERYPQNSENTCLARRDFQDFQQLKCVPSVLEATPRVFQHHETVRKCGDEAFLYRVLFLICPSDPSWGPQYQYITNSLAIYDFCYNGDRGKILFTSHYINAPKLLATFLLYQDRTLNYPYENDGSYPIANYNYLYRYEESNSSIVSRYPNYTVQNFVPSEDMAFGIWKKAINRSTNIGLQHNNIIDIWNLINEKVREEVIRQDKDDNDVLFLVKTGILDNSVGIPTDGQLSQLYNNWIKMIIRVQRQTETAMSGVVFLINNFTNIGHHDLHVDQLQSLLNEYEGYCEESFDCVRKLKGMVKRAKGSMKCCLVTKKLGQLFGVITNDTLPILHIPELTIPTLRP